ncbi:MAG: SpoIIE family protein phosphatase [Candidatus Methanoperedens sp.]|nr:SpoIIE family protein phosphatase [Candidatus Methanoperedens sp.]
MSNVPIEWGVAIMPLPGQDISGDMHIVKLLPDVALVAVVDGLGHGYEAAAASEIAIATLDAYAHEPIISLVRRCHEALRGTRGVVMSVASLNTRDRTMVWLGVGNIEGVLLRADKKATPSREDLLLRGGVLGYQLPPLREYTVPLMQGDTLIFATDGISSGFYREMDMSEQPQKTADNIMARCFKGTDDALVLVVLFTGCNQ